MGARPYQFAAKARSPRPAHITLGQLHHVVQMVAGWTDEHLHQFTLPPLWHASPAANLAARCLRYSEARSRSALNHAQGASANMNKGSPKEPCQ
ncbi:IS1096 element passenger TnpR family protein (plasmid) [Cupriavidus basilensis]